MSPAPSARTRVRREPKRADYDRATIDAILDEALIAHLGIAVDGQPYVIPMLSARVEDVVYLHGATSSRLMRALAGRAAACLTVTLVDGIVLARSVFNHSMNYRSVVLLGEAREVTGEEERVAAMRAFTEGLVPGRWDEVRTPSRKELKATRMIALDIDEASAKVRTGPPEDDEDDHALDVWAGVIPLALGAGPPEADPRLRDGLEPSAVVNEWTPAPGRRAPAPS